MAIQKPGGDIYEEARQEVEYGNKTEETQI